MAVLCAAAVSCVLLKQKESK